MLRPSASVKKTVDIVLRTRRAQQLASSWRRHYRAPLAVRWQPPDEERRAASRATVDRIHLAKDGPTLPILRRSPGFVVGALASNASVSSKELSRWLARQSFPPSHLPILLAAAKERTWSAATTVLADSDPAWATETSPTVLAYLAREKVSTSTEADEAIAVLAHRAAVDSTVEDASDCLAAIARIASDRGEQALLSEVVAYSNRFTNLLASNAVAQEADRPEEFFTSAHTPRRSRTTPRELAPSLAVLDALVINRPWDHVVSSGPHLRTLLSTLDALCAEAPYDSPIPSRGLLHRLGRTDADLVLRAAVALLSSERALPVVSELVDLLDASPAHPSTLRSALKTLIRLGPPASPQIEQLAAQLCRVEGVQSPAVATLWSLRPAEDPEASLEPVVPWVDLLYGESRSSAELFARAVHLVQWRTEPDLPLRMWKSLVARRAPLSTAALNAAISACIDINDPREATRLFRAHARPSASTSSSPSDTDTVTADATTVGYFLQALERSHRYNEVWSTFNDLTPVWNVQPEDFHLRYLLRSARAITSFSSPPDGPFLRRPGPAPSEALVEDDWDGEPAATRAIAAFWSTLHSGRPALIEPVLESVKGLVTGSRWTFAAFAGRSAPLTVPRASRRFDVHASTVVPSLAFDRHRAIEVQEPTFKEMVELLGMTGLGHEIPLLLGWMRGLGLVPRRGTLTAAYVWFLHCAPRRSDVAKLDAFVAGWLGPERVPSHDEAVELISSRVPAHKRR